MPDLPRQKFVGLWARSPYKLWLPSGFVLSAISRARVPRLGRHAFVASIVSYIGLDPRKDIIWVNASAADSMRLFTEGVFDVRSPPREYGR